MVEAMDVAGPSRKQAKHSDGKGLDSRPWVEKYRPSSLAEVAAHKEIIETVGRLAREDKLPHLLLYGPPGTGKTSTIIAMAREIYGEGYQNMTLELNASDDRGIAVVREQIQDFASTRRIFSTGFKLVVLDECDAMTKDAQYALRRIIEKYTKNTRFCLICNYVSKIIPALQSRCTRFRFAPLPRDCVRERISEIAQAESVSMTDNGIDAVIDIANGDMRKVLNIMQSTAMTAASVNDKAVYACTGNPDPSQIAECSHWLMNLAFTECFNKIRALQTQKGFALLDIIRALQPWIFKVNIPTLVRVELVSLLADLEHRLSLGSTEQLQLGALVGGFVVAREKIVQCAA